MRALICNEYGPADKLDFEERDIPTPGAGEVTVDVRAAAINFPDALIIAGKYQVKIPPPFIPGSECAGMVREVGEGVSHVKPGDRVIALPEGGAYAEVCCVPAMRVIPIGPKMSFTDAAGFTITYGTSYHAYKQSAQLKEGETVLVLGAAGGVGITAVELAKVMGARVIAAASSDEKLAFCREAGADETINYSTENLKERVKELTDGRGADVVYDPVGGSLAIDALKATAWHGRYLVIGFASGDIPQMPANLALLKEASIVGVWWGTWLARDPKAGQENMMELLQMAAGGKLRPRVTDVYAIEDYAEAFAQVTERRAKGKVIMKL